MNVIVIQLIGDHIRKKWEHNKQLITDNLKKLGIDKIWDDYDEDGSGDLDKEETKKFVIDTMKRLGVDEGFTDEAFNEMFDSIDDDGSGVLGKPEMVILLK